MYRFLNKKHLCWPVSLERLRNDAKCLKTVLMIFDLWSND